MKSLEKVLEELATYGNPNQRVVIYIDGFDHYYDTSVGGARVAVKEDMSKLMVESVDDDDATETWLPVAIHCKVQN